MMKIISNIYPIVNLNQLTSEYRLVEIKGLTRNKEFQANIQIIINKLSRKLKHPVTVINSEITDSLPKLVVKNNKSILGEIPKEMVVVRGTVYFTITNEIFSLDFTKNDNDSKRICLRFLQFDIQGQLRNISGLWQPYSGGPYFQTSNIVLNNIAIYKGFIARAIELPDGGYGIIIDAARKYSSPNPLKNYMTRNEFAQFGSKSFIYKYGSKWYEIQPKEISDLNATEYKIENESLIDYIRKNIPKPHDLLLANIPSDSSVLEYYTSENQSRGVPTGLCFEVFDFQDTNSEEVNRTSIIGPNERFREIIEYRKRYFNNLEFGNTTLVLSQYTCEIEKKIFSYPGFILGNNNILSKNDFNYVSDDLPYKIAKERLRRITNPDIGFYSNDPFINQFFVLPRSISDSSGDFFIRELKSVVNKMYPHDEYNPLLLTFEDKFKKGTDYTTLGKLIVNEITDQLAELPSPKYGVVMIPNLEKKKKREHDKLSALIIRELSRIGASVTVIHSDTISKCLEQIPVENRITYRPIRKLEGRFNGYIRNVAISKILLNSNKWPFILTEPLNADVTIGIDVKVNTAGFTIIDKYAKNIRTRLITSRAKEKLPEKEIQTIFYDIISEQVNFSSYINKIVIHRDGRLFDTELFGLNCAFNALMEKEILPKSASLTIIEIPKKSFYSVRFFNISYNSNNQTQYQNPNIGLNLAINNYAFLCSTGQEFRHDGTSVPLYVKFIQKGMKSEEILEDLFKLTTLAFTKPDDCSRYPLTIKINDIKLSDAASEYDEDNYRLLPEYELSNAIENE
ncbi:MAG: hypothetical protein JW973_15445 [Bacteroidales bacterium]|nr:hypothetical protein [Bacteroidales bacterium]